MALMESSPKLEPGARPAGEAAVGCGGHGPVGPAGRVAPGAIERAARVAGLEERGRELSGVLATAAAGLVAVIAEAIEGALWCGFGIRSVEHWVKLRFGVSDARARRLVAAARVLGGLPACRAAFEAGEITEDHVAELARAQTTAVHDEQAVELARHATVGQLRTGLSFLPEPPADSDPEPEAGSDAEPEPDPDPDPDPDQAPAPEPVRERPGSWVGFGTRDDGTWGLVARTDPLRGALVELALTAARNQLFRARHGTHPAEGQAPSDVTWTDAFVHLAHVALDAMDPATAGHPGRAPSDRYMVNVHIRAEDPDAATVHLGPVLPADLRGRATCDARVRAWIVDQVGNVGLGRTQHCVDPKLRAVVEARDGGCVVPGCDATKWLEIHHFVHWEDGGPTETWNLGAACGSHHDAAHRGDIGFTGNPDLGTLQIWDRNGRLITAGGPIPPGAPAPEAARAAGLADPAYRMRSGERAQWDCMVWHDHPPPTDPPERQGDGARPDATVGHDPPESHGDPRCGDPPGDPDPPTAA